MKNGIVLIVEGQSESRILPAFVRRILHDWGVYDVEVDSNPVRENRKRLIKPEILTMRLLQAAGRTGAAGVLVLIDADDDAACRLGPKLLGVGKSSIALPIGFVLAVREIEAWLLAGIESLRGVANVRFDAAFSGDPESGRDAKKRLRRLMTCQYHETAHLGPMLMRLAYEDARRRSPSLDKFLRELRGLVNACRSLGKDSE